MPKRGSHTEAGPPERQQTIRQAILQRLLKGPHTARELSSAVGVREREIPLHLEHIRKSLSRSDQRFVIEPALCQSCGFVFSKRLRLTRPSSCPKCRDQHIDPPVFYVESPQPPPPQHSENMEGKKG